MKEVEGDIDTFERETSQEFEDKITSQFNLIEQERRRNKSHLGVIVNRGVYVPSIDTRRSYNNQSSSMHSSKSIFMGN